MFYLYNCRLILKHKVYRTIITFESNNLCLTTLLIKVFETKKLRKRKLFRTMELNYIKNLQLTQFSNLFPTQQAENIVQFNAARV